MANKKDNSGLSEAEALSKRVDAILDPRLPNPAPTPNIKSGDAPLEVTKTASTAPEIPGDLAQKVDAKPQPASPAPPLPTPEPKPELELHSPKSAPAPVLLKPTQSTLIDDQATDQAVEDIAAKEGDTMLNLQDAIGRKASHVASDLAAEDRKAARHRKWAWATLFVLAVVLFLLIAPYTPYTCRWPVGIRLSVTTDILPSVCK